MSNCKARKSKLFLPVLKIPQKFKGACPKLHLLREKAV